MNMARENALELMVKTESTKYANWSDFGHSSSFLQLSKAIT